MAWSEPEVGCKKHPNHQQLPGVCASCLRERLSKLSAPSPQNKTTMDSSCSSSLFSPPPYSSASSSPYISPVHRRRHRNTSGVMRSISFIITGSGGLRKSRSIGFAARSQSRECTGRKKKGGFWSKLLGSTEKRTKEVFMHSRTMKERFQY